MHGIISDLKTYYLRSGLSRSHTWTVGKFKPNILRFSSREACFLVAFGLCFKTLYNLLKLSILKVVYGNPILKLLCGNFLELHFFLNSR